MNEKLNTIYGYLSSQNIKNFPSTYEDFESMMQDDAKAQKVHSFLVSKNIKNIDSDFTIFSDYVGRKKKVPPTPTESYLTSLAEGTKPLENLLKEPEKPTIVQPPLRSGKKKELTYQDTLPDDITPTSIFQSATKRTEYLKQEYDKTIGELQGQLQEESDKLQEDYKKKGEQEGSNKKQLKTELSTRLADLEFKKQKEAEKQIADLFGEQKYEVLAKGDIKNIEKQVQTIMDSPALFDAKNKAIEAFREDFMSKVVSAIPEYSDTVRKELNDVIARNTVYQDEEITPFGWKQEASRKLAEHKASADKIISDFQKKYPDFQERTTAMPGGLPVTQGFSPSADKDEAKRKQFYADYQQYKKDISLLGVAQEKLGNVLQLPDDKANFTTAFKAKGVEFIEAISSAGWSDVANSLEYGTLAKKVQDGVKLSEGEKAAFEAKNILDTAYSKLEGGKLGKVVAEGIPFLESMFTLGTAGVGSKVLKETLKELAAKEGAKVLSLKGAKIAGKQVGKMVRAATVAAPLSPISYQRQLSGVAGQSYLNEQGEWEIDKSTIEGWGEATAKGMATGGTEYFTESISGLFGPAGSNITPLLQKLGWKNFRIPQGITDLAKTAQFGNMSSEIMEELVNIPLQAPIGDQPLSEVTLQDVWDTVWTTAGFTAILGSSAIVGGVMDMVRNARDMKFISKFDKNSVDAINLAIKNGDKNSWMDAITTAVSDKTEEELGMTKMQAMQKLYDYSKSLATEIVIDNKQAELITETKVQEEPTDATKVREGTESTGQQAQGVVEGTEERLRIRNIKENGLETQQGEKVTPSGKTTSIYVAPYRVSKVEKLDDNTAFEDTGYQQLRQETTNIAKAFKLDVSETTPFIGGYTEYNAETGETSRSQEPSVRIDLPTTNVEDVELASALLGSLAPETQNSVMQVSYGNDKAGVMLNVSVKDAKSAERITSQLKNLGFSFDNKGNVLYLASQNNSEYDQLLKILNDNTDGITGVSRQQADISFFGEGQYRETLSKFKDSGRYGRDDWKDLSLYVDKAIAKLEGKTQGEPVVKEPTNIDRSIEKVSESLGITFPNVKIVVGDNLEQTQEKLYQTLVDRGISKTSARKIADNFTDLDAGQSIFKGNKPVAVVINKGKANTRTAGHEIWELILNNAFNRDTAKLKEFRDAIDETLRKDGYSYVADKLNKFVDKYQGDVQFTEYMAEFGGYLVEGGLDIKNVSPKEQTLLDHIKEIINKFAKALTGKEVFLKDATPKDIVAFMTTISEKIAQGKDITKYMVEGEAPPNATGIRAVRQSVSVMKGQESMKKFGLSYIPNNTRVVAEALEKRQRSKYGIIPRNDRSKESLKKISKWMVQEIEYFIDLMGEKSGKGWYGELYQKALKQMETVFPEFKTDPNARDLFTMLVAITSDGTRVLQNFNMASQAYDVYRKSKGKKLPTTLPSVRIKSVENNLKVLKNLLEEYDGNIAEIKKYLLRIDTINNINKERKALGLDKLATSWPTTFKVPTASSLFGPKLGMFYANLSGMENYPTLDRWWSRLFNRYRGTLIPSINRGITDKGVKMGIDRLKSLLGNSSLSDEEALLAAKTYRDSYMSKGFKNGTELEKVSNTIYKTAYETLNDAPFNPSDRAFMYDAISYAVKSLNRKGYNITIADAQAILWYFEKNLYKKLGVRANIEGVSYENAAKENIKKYIEAGNTFNYKIQNNEDDYSVEEGDDQIEAEEIIARRQIVDIPEEEEIIPEKEEVKPTGKRKREIGRKVVEESTLPKEVKDALLEEGIEYVPRGAKITDREAKALIDVFAATEEGLTALANTIYDVRNDIPPDTRTTLNIYLADLYSKQLNIAKTLEEREAVRKKLVDAFLFGQEQATRAGQAAQSQIKWRSILSRDPESIIIARKRAQSKDNAEALKAVEADLKQAKKMLDDIFDSPEFKKILEERVNEEIGKIAEKKYGAVDKKKINDFFDSLIIPENNLFDATVGIPIAVYNGALRVIQKAVSAGVDIVNAVAQAVEYIDNWYKQNYADNKITSPVWNKADYIAVMEERLKPLSKKVKKVKYTLPRKVEDNLIADIYSKMEHATKPQLKRLIREYITTLEERGAIYNFAPITQSAFNDMFARAIGLDVLSQEDEQIIRLTAQSINNAQEEADKLVDAFDRYIKESNKENPDKAELSKLEEEINTKIKAEAKARKDAQRAAQKLDKLMQEEKTLVSTIETLVKLNLLTPISLITNIGGNLIIQPVRFATRVVASALDIMTSGVGLALSPLRKIDTVKHPRLKKYIDKIPSSKRVYRSFSRIPVALSFAKGTWEGLQQMFTGQLTEDLYNRELSRGLEPVKAAISFYERLTGKKKFAVDKLLSDFLEAMPAGYIGEFFGRGLNLGDKPFRKAAERARLEEIANTKGLKGVEREKFMFKPDEESFEEARKAGQLAVYQNDSLISDIVQSIKVKLKNTPAADTTKRSYKIAKALGSVALSLTAPYVKTPINLIAEAFDYAVPPYSMVRGIIEMQNGNRRAATKSFGKAVVGYAIVAVTIELIKNGILTPPPDEDEKIRNAQYTAKQGYSMNVDALWRLKNGEDPQWREGDQIVNIQRFGVLSMIMMGLTKAYTEMPPEKVDDMSKLTMTVNMLPTIMSSSFDQSFLSGTATAFAALTQGGIEQENWLVNTSKALSSTIYPNVLAQMSQTFASENYIREVRDIYDRELQLRKRLVNTFKDRMFMGQQLPTKVSIWGDRVNRIPEGRNWPYMLFDITKGTKYQKSSFGSRMFDFYERYKFVDEEEAKNILPSLPSPRTVVGWDDRNMTPQETEELQMEVGQARRMQVQFLMDSPEWETMDDSERIIKLQQIYRTSASKAKAKMFLLDDLKENKDTWKYLENNDFIPIPTKRIQIKIDNKKYTLDEEQTKDYYQIVQLIFQEKLDLMDLDPNEVVPIEDRERKQESLSKKWNSAKEKAKSRMKDLIESE